MGKEEPTPLVRIAEFAAVGSGDAVAEARAMQDRVAEAIRSQASAVGVGVRVRVLREVVVPDRAGAALRRAVSD